VKASRRAASAALAGASAAARAVLPPGAAKLRAERGTAALLLAARGGARYASSAPRLFTAAGEHREQLRNDLALQTAQDVAATLGTMKGVLMKLGHPPGRPAPARPGDLPIRRPAVLRQRQDVPR
jgi:hypothetical protein